MAYLRQRSYINFRMLLRVVGWLLMIESIFMIAPLLADIVFQEGNVWPLLFCIGITVGCGMAMMSIKPTNRYMGKREAVLLTAFTWIILSVFGMLPFMLCGTHETVTDAFFETMSGFTTTGASVLDTLSVVPKSLLLWRCVVQWIGGLGIILFTLAVLPMLNYQGGIQLFNAEVTGITHDKLRPRVSFTARGLWLVYIILTAILFIMLSLSDMTCFDSLCYSLSTMSTGGFATSDLSVTEHDSLYVKIILLVFMFLGGVNFSLLFKASRGDVKSAIRNDALRWYVCLIIICYAVFTINIALRGIGRGIEDYTVNPLFQSVSILSSTGLTQPDFWDWGPVAVIVLIAMMFIGACAGSTAGGAKIDRFIILFKFLKNEFYKMMHPDTVTTVTINGKGTPTSVLMKTLAFLFLYVVVIVVGGVVLCIDGMPLKDSFFVCLSSVSNTGLGTSITGLNGNYSEASDLTKWVLSLIMLIGRLELYTVLLLFIPSFWRK